MTSRIPALALALTLIAGCAGADQPQAPAAHDGGLAHPTIDLQGHRGARGLLPENTIPSFKKALEYGVTTLELDVVVSADSQVVVSHEPWFSSSICTDAAGRPIAHEDERSFNIFSMSYDSIRAFDCGSIGNPNFPEQEAVAVGKPLLDSALVAAERYADELGRPMPAFNIEIKSRAVFDGTFTPEPAAFARLVHDVIVRNGVADRTVVQSFDPRALRAMRAIDGDIKLALLVDNDLGLVENLEKLGFTPDVYSPHQRLVDEVLVAAAHDEGMEVIPWTVNEPDAMRHLLDLGVDGLITDYPDRAVIVLEALPE